MRTFPIQPVSLLAGGLLSAIGLLAMAQKPTPERTAYEYQILVDVESKELPGLARDGWEFAGYLGQSKMGAGSDETLWRRPE